MNKKLKIGILFGGKSAEHEISLLSAKNIVDSIDKTKYEVVLIGIDKTGEWHLRDAVEYLKNADNPKLVHLNRAVDNVALVPKDMGQQLVSLSKQRQEPLDVIFPVLHGTYGEDGSIQGLLKMAGIPYVGAGVLGSAVGMDKDVMKRLLRDAGLPVAKFFTVRRREREKYSFTFLQKELSLPFFIKPANLGSSVGVCKVKDESDFEAAMDKAFLYDDKILVEEFIEAREIECSVLGNEDPIVSIPGEVIVRNDEFYSYDAKYIEDQGTFFEIPAKLDKETCARVQNLAKETFTILCCEGMARIDMFLKKNGEVLINEINTIPGFTNTSMYPQLWKASGYSLTYVVDRLIHLAIEKHDREKQLKTTF